MFYFSPCEIARFTKIPCEDVLSYIIVHFPTRKIVASLGLSSEDYLQQLSQSSIVPQKTGC